MIQKELCQIPQNGCLKQELQRSGFSISCADVSRDNLAQEFTLKSNQI